MAIPLLLCGIGVLFATCAACFYRMGAADWADEKKFLIDSLEFLASENAKLRNLARDMMRYYFMPSTIDRKQRETELIERANELGVEEDDGELGVEVDG